MVIALAPKGYFVKNLRLQTNFEVKNKRNLINFHFIPIIPLQFTLNHIFDNWQLQNSQ